MISIKQSPSVSNEFYLGDKPGTLQYNKDPNEFYHCFEYNKDDNVRGYILCDINEEYLMEKLSPKTKKGKQLLNWQLICVMKREDDDGTIWLKGAFLDTKENKIALMTSTNNIILVNRPINSHKEGWFIGHYRMTAPKIFWYSVAESLILRNLKDKNNL